MKENPFVSIVVASYNRKYIIKENIQSLIALDYPNESYEIVLIDNYSMDGTIEEVNRHFSEYIDSGFLKVVPLPYNSGSSGSYVEALNFMNPDWEYMLKMDEYITRELPKLIAANFPADMSKQGITGHSMGGHGALTMAFKNPELFKSVSAFAPICSPTKVGWGENAFAAYLGDQMPAWFQYDSTELILSRGWHSDILIDQGLDDEYLNQYLKPGLLQEACKQKNVQMQLRQHEGYDHSYFFIASFIEDHLRWHNDRL